MKLTNVNNSQNQNANLQNLVVREGEFQNLVDKQQEIRVSDREDRLEMLGDGKRKDRSSDFKEFVERKQEIFKLRESRSLVARHYMVMNNIKALVSDSLDQGLSLGTREENQEKIDGFTKDLRALADNIYGKIKTKALDPKNLGLTGIVSLAKMGKVTVKSRKGKNERIYIYYTGDTNKTIDIDLDKNTGDILLEAGKRFREMKNETIKSILENKAYGVQVLEEDLDKSFYKGLDFDLEDLTLEDLGEDIVEGPEYRPSGERLAYLGTRKIIEIPLEGRQDLVGLSVMNHEEVLESFEKIEEALKTTSDFKEKIASLEDRLEIDLNSFYRQSLKIADIKNFEDARDKMERIKENILSDNNYLDYLRKLQDPGLVYKLLL